MFPAVTAAATNPPDPNWMNVYSAKAMSTMWTAIAESWK